MSEPDNAVGWVEDMVVRGRRTGADRRHDATLQHHHAKAAAPPAPVPQAPAPEMPFLNPDRFPGGSLPEAVTAPQTTSAGLEMLTSDFGFPAICGRLRRRPDSNWCTRLCRPLPNLSATAPRVPMVSPSGCLKIAARGATLTVR